MWRVDKELCSSGWEPCSLVSMSVLTRFPHHSGLGIKPPCTWSRVKGRMPSRRSVLQLRCFSSLSLVLACVWLWFLSHSFVMDWTLVWLLFYAPLHVSMVLWVLNFCKIVCVELRVSAIRHSPCLPAARATGQVSTPAALRWHEHRWAVMAWDCPLHTRSATGSDTGALDLSP